MASIAFLVSALGLTSALGADSLALEMDGHGLMRRESLASVSGHYERGAQPAGITADTGDDAGTPEATPAVTPDATTDEATAPADADAPADATDDADATADAVAAGPTNSTAYFDAIMDSDPVGYWTMGSVSDGRVHGKGKACGQPNWDKFGDPCTVDGYVMGGPAESDGLLPTNSVAKALHFSGADNEEVKLPDHPMINTDGRGYTTRTVELWFKSEAPGDISRVLYCEGNSVHSGMSMYVKDAGGKLKLAFYAWDRGNHENEFGTSLVNTQPIGCDIQADKAYYVAMEFDAPNEKFSAWIGGSGDSSDLTLCGQMDNIPVNVMLHHHGHGGGNAVIGGIHTSSREDGSDGGKMVGQSHNFKGVIEDVAMYNRAVPLDELQKHYDAGAKA